MVVGVFVRAEDVTASASPLVGGPTDALYVGTAGTLVVTMKSGVSVSFAAIAGAILPIQVTHVTTSPGGVKALYR
jgi:hypothetical protein